MNSRQLEILASVEDEEIRRAVYTLMTVPIKELKRAVCKLPQMSPVLRAAMRARA